MWTDKRAADHSRSQDLISTYFHILYYKIGRIVREYEVKAVTRSNLNFQKSDCPRTNELNRRPAMHQREQDPLREPIARPAAAHVCFKRIV